MNRGNKIKLKIEKMVYEGAGLGFYDGKAVFVKGACPDDELVVEIVKNNKNFASANIVEVIKPSQNRVKPFCPLFNACGGCSWQQIDYDVQLEQKLNIVKEALKKFNVGIEGIVKSPKAKGFRHKVQYPIRQTKVSKRVLCGYFKEKTHDITDIKFCPVQAEGIDSVIAKIRECSKDGKNLYFDAYNEKTGLGLLRHVLIRKSLESGKMLIVLVLNARKQSLKTDGSAEISNRKISKNSVPTGIKRLAKILYSNFDIAGVVANFNNKRTNVILGEEFETIIGDNFLIEKLKDKIFKISAGSFFQVNPYTACEIFDYVKSTVVKGGTLLDAYGGTAPFSVWLKGVAKYITLCEQSKSSVSDARENFKLNNIKNFEILEGDCSNELSILIKHGKSFDNVIIDPPRSGSDEKTLKMLGELTRQRLIYVSCNPQTLARDMEILVQKGFKPLKVKCFDMFCHTYHIETVVVFEKL